MLKTSITQILIFIIVLSDTLAFNIKPPPNKFPKIAYTKIHDISYRKPIYIPRKRPYIFNLVKQLNETIYNIINNYIDEVYGMAIFPLSFTIPNKLNQTNDTLKKYRK